VNTVGLSTFLRQAWSWLIAAMGHSTPAALFRRADRYRNEGRYDEAARLVVQGLQEDPGSSVGHLLSAYLHVANRAMDAAKADFHRVLALDRYHPRALVGLAKINLEEQDIEGATSLLDRALQYYSDFPEARALREMVVSWSKAPAAAGEGHPAAVGGDPITAVERDVVVTRLDGVIVYSKIDEERAGQVAQHLIQVYRMASATLARAGFGIPRRSVIDTGSQMTFVLSDTDHLLSATLDGNVEIGAGLAQTGRLWTEIGTKA
jgi:tetratricopeptide (TPR) repeat protein